MEDDRGLADSVMVLLKYLQVWTEVVGSTLVVDGSLAVS